MNAHPRFVIGWAAVVPLLFTAACASSGSSPAPSPIETAPVPAPPSMQDLYEAGDYAGVVRVFSAYTTLARQDTALFQAAIASAMPDHAGHDLARALRLFHRLRTRHPGSAYLAETRLLINLLETTASMSDQNDRLKQELEQMKAIDLGQQP